MPRINHITGGDSFILDITKTGGQSGHMSIWFGCEGYDQKNELVRIDNSVIRDSNSGIVGSINIGDTVSISGTIQNTGIAYLINEEIASTIVGKSNEDINLINISGHTGNEAGFIVKYQANSKIDWLSKTGLLMTTNSNIYKDAIQIISGMIGSIEISSGQYSGVSVGVSSKSENDYDLFIFGYNDTGEYSKIDGPFWSSIEKPIIFLGASQAGMSGLGIITNFNYGDISDNGIFGSTFSGTIKNVYDEAFVRRIEAPYVGKAVVSSTGEVYDIQPFSGVTKVTINSSVFHILAIGNYADLPFVSMIEKNGVSFPLMPVQSEDRLIINMVGTGENTLTDYGKKILTNSVYELFRDEEFVSQ